MDEEKKEERERMKKFNLRRSDFDPPSNSYSYLIFNEFPVKHLKVR